ncbi:NAD-dependent epimerase/dehydratase family protein [Candidatus Manganitrophus noduliformans]|uniref:NAD-dependent epimerase/dehydratase family protein n=1 Tax=Candidatus Manganitrophus noduliformans TaxID=2606439 RepID=A0A7X6DM45_9BACT|nr:NAD-dependent epimerase/dehydratase family protein [Candidatus Manganitrophus noduliformans]NKE69762.1 NAD-dependent epimerase/dehydratase family protein [Candidatus Manganitrophus noduliformans]
MRYFITGATGFVGGAIARQLAAAGHQVTALVRHTDRAHHLARLGIALHPGDITDKESMRAPMTGADGIFHVAGWYKIGSKTPALGKKINVDGTRNVLELMRELRIPRGVYTSTLLVFSDTRGKLVDEATHYEGPWLSEYERTKWMAHTQIAEPMMKEGLPLIIVLPGLVYGPGDTSSVRNLLIQYLKGRLPISPQKTAYAWGHVEDIAEGHLLAMEKGRPGERYILAGPTHTLQEALAIAEQITGINAPRLHPSPALLRRLAQIVRWIEPILPLPEFYRSESIRAIAGVTYIGSGKKAQRELGFTARPLEEGLCETLLHEMKLLGIRSKRI